MAYPFSDSQCDPSLTASGFRMRRGEALSGWTVIEILFVMAIIAILTGITFGLLTGVHRRTAIGRAKGELAVLSTSLEAYRTQYGDYPWIPSTMPSGISTNEEIVFNALAGKVGPKGAALNGRVFLEPSRLNLENSLLPDPDTTSSVSNAFIDPWGQRYRYYYKNEGSEGNWTDPSFRLFSIGVDGAWDPPDAAGIIDYGHEDNVDNVHVGRD